MYVRKQNWYKFVMKFSCLLKMVKQIHPLLHSSIKTKLSYRDKKNTVRENAIQDDKLQEKLLQWEKNI